MVCIAVLFFVFFLQFHQVFVLMKEKILKKEQKTNKKKTKHFSKTILGDELQDIVLKQ